MSRATRDLHTNTYKSHSFTHSWATWICHMWHTFTLIHTSHSFTHSWVTCLCHMWHTFTWLDSLLHMTRLFHSHVWLHTNETCRTWLTYQHKWSHVTHMDESCHTYGWGTSHTWMDHDAPSEISKAPARVLKGWWYIWKRHDTFENVMIHMKTSRHTYQRVMSYIWSNVTLMDGWVNHDTHMDESRLWNFKGTVTGVEGLMMRMKTSCDTRQRVMS